MECKLAELVKGSRALNDLRDLVISTIRLYAENRVLSWKINLKLFSASSSTLVKILYRDGLIILLVNVPLHVVTMMTLQNAHNTNKSDVLLSLLHPDVPGVNNVERVAMAADC